jgi:hypothetical protein
MGYERVWVLRNKRKRAQKYQEKSGKIGKNLLDD